MADISQLSDDEIIQALRDAGIFDPQTQANTQRLHAAQNLANTPAPQGVHTGGMFSTYVAPNPLQQLSAAVRQGVGLSREQQAMDAQQQNIGNLGNAYATAGGDQLAKLRALMQAQGGQVQPGVQSPADFVPTDSVPFGF